MPRRGHTVFDTRILNGCPVEVEANIYPAEPDVGIFHEQVEITAINWPYRRGQKKPRPIPDSMYDRITPAEFAQLEQDALESVE